MPKDHDYYVYFVASQSRVLYCGVTNSIRRRMMEHRQGAIQGFSSTYKCNRLVWCEHYQYIDNAIAREKQLKRWRRAKKLQLIESTNPSWGDLSEAWLPKTADLSTTLRFGRDDKADSGAGRDHKSLRLTCMLYRPQTTDRLP